MRNSKDKNLWQKLQHGFVCGLLAFSMILPQSSISAFAEGEETTIETTAETIVDATENAEETAVEEPQAEVGNSETTLVSMVSTLVAQDDAGEEYSYTADEINAVATDLENQGLLLNAIEQMTVYQYQFFCEYTGRENVFATSGTNAVDNVTTTTVDTTQTDIDTTLISNNSDNTSYSVVLPRTLDVTTSGTKFPVSVSGTLADYQSVDVAIPTSETMTPEGASGTVALTISGESGVSWKKTQDGTMISTTFDNTVVSPTASLTRNAVITHGVIPEGNWSATLPVTISFNNDSRAGAVYGIKRVQSDSSTLWTRTDDAEGLTALASWGTNTGYSSFDSIYPWSAMKRYVITNNDVSTAVEWTSSYSGDGDVMVYVPEFYYKRVVTDGVETIQIAGVQLDGFTRHPGSGRYVGAYETGSTNKSVKNVLPTVSKSRSAMRNDAKLKGASWSLLDVATWNAIEMLYLVEYADNNSQTAIGRGNTGASSASVTGYCDKLSTEHAYLTGTVGSTRDTATNTASVCYRGIENLWGSVWEWMDGLNQYNGAIYICTDPSNYADNTSTNYTLIGYSLPTASSWQVKMGYDSENSWVYLPTTGDVTAGNSTYISDYYWYSSDAWRVAGVGGDWSNGVHAGLSSLVVNCTSSIAGVRLGSRLVCQPS